VAEDVTGRAVRIGLVSDTHIPQRCKVLPRAVFDALEGVDLILHAGDVGDLAVLDSLGELAPVVAVHGNDESVEAKRELPARVVISVRGTRILLWHGHHEDRARELASRAGDEFVPKLAELASHAHVAGASVAVFGHWHIPLARLVDGVLLVNPGAIASGNEVTRQLRQTVAVLTIRCGLQPQVFHRDLAAPDEQYDPQIDWESGFKRTLDRFSCSILEPDLASRFVLVRDQLSSQEREWLRTLILPLAHACWQGDLAAIDLASVCRLVRADMNVPAEVKSILCRLFCELC